MPNGNFQIVSTIEGFTVLRKPTFCLSIPKPLCTLSSFSEIVYIKTLGPGQCCPLKHFCLLALKGTWYVVQT